MQDYYTFNYRNLFIVIFTIFLLVMFCAQKSKVFVTDFDIHLHHPTGYTAK